MIMSMLLSLLLCPEAAFSEMIWTKNSKEIKEIKSEIMDLARKLKKLTVELSGAKKQSDKRVKELSGMIEGTGEGLEALSVRLKAIEQEAPEYQRVTGNRLAELQKSLNEYERRVISLEGELKELPQKIISAVEKINERIVESKTASLRQEFKSGMEDTAVSIRDTESRVAGLDKKALLLEREIGKSKADLRASQESLREEIGREIGTLEVRRTVALKEAQDDYQEALKEYRQESAASINSLQTELVSLKGDTGRIESEFGSKLKLHKESLQKDYSALTDEISGREKEREGRIAAGFKDVENALKERDKRLASLGDAIQRNSEERRSDLASLEDKIVNTFNKRKEDIALLISTLSKEIDRKGEGIDTLKNSLKELNDLMVSRDLEVTDTLKKFINESAGKKSEEMAALEAAITGSLKERDTRMISLITNISKELARGSEETAALRSLAARLNTRIEMNEKDVAAIREDVSSYLQKRDAELAALEKAITATLKESSGEVSALITTVSGRLKEIEAAIDAEDNARVDLGKKVALMIGREASLKNEILDLKKNSSGVVTLKEIKELKTAIERQKRDNEAVTKRLEKIDLSIKMIKARSRRVSKDSSESNSK